MSDWVFFSHSLPLRYCSTVAWITQLLVNLLSLLFFSSPLCVFPLHYFHDFFLFHSSSAIWVWGSWCGCLFCLGFIELLKSVNLQVTSNLENFWPFISWSIFFLSFLFLSFPFVTSNSYSKLLHICPTDHWCSSFFQSFFFQCFIFSTFYGYVFSPVVLNNQFLFLYSVSFTWDIVCLISRCSICFFSLINIFHFSPHYVLMLFSTFLNVRSIFVIPALKSLSANSIFCVVFGYVFID